VPPAAFDVFRGRTKIFLVRNVYDRVPDSATNGYFSWLGAEDVGRIDAEDREIRIFKTADAALRDRGAGLMDSQDGCGSARTTPIASGCFDNGGDRKRLSEWTIPTPGAWGSRTTSRRNKNGGPVES